MKDKRYAFRCLASLLVCAASAIGIGLHPAFAKTLMGLFAVAAALAFSLYCGRWLELALRK